MIEYKQVSSSYRLLKDYEFTHELLKEFIDYESESGYSFSKDKLKIFAGFGWDGPTGAINTDNLMRASLVHDVLTHEANRFSGEEYKRLRKIADQIYYQIAKEDGVSAFRATYQLCAISVFGFFKSIFK